MGKMSIEQIKNKRKNEKDSLLMMKNLISKPTKFKSTDFKPGKMLMYSYFPKKDKNPYDSSPLIIVLRRNTKYTLGLNLNWCPPVFRQKVITFILNKNSNNIKQSKEIEVDYKMIKKIIKGLGPVVRLYLNNRISNKGVVIPSYQFTKVINLRSENFIGISAEKAWNLAVSDFKSKNTKRKKRRHK